MESTQKLAGQVALVTGGNGGIGRAIAAALSLAGAKVATTDLVAFCDDDQLRQDGDSHRHYQVDLLDFDQVAALPRRVNSDFGQLDIVVNNAGRRGIFDLLDYPLSDWQETIAVNLTAPFLIAREASKFMVARGRGRIINIASVAAELGFTQRSAYNASKGGLVMLTKSIALELGKHGVTCNAVSPGIVETPINSAYLRDSPESPAIVSGTPVGHWGQPADIAAAVVFLASPEASFVNGAVLNVDGGWTSGKGY